MLRFQAQDPPARLNTTKAAKGLPVGNDPSGQCKALQTPFSSAAGQSAQQTPLREVSVAQNTPAQTVKPTSMQNGAADPQANGVMQPKLAPKVLKKLLMANGISEAAAGKGMERGM